SRVQQDQGVGFITVWGWEYLCAFPLVSFVALELVENFAELLVGTLHFHDQMRGCINDLCAFKTEISFKMRTADICPECTELFLSRASAADLDAVVDMLEEVRRVALGRQGRSAGHGRAPSAAERVDREYPFPIAYCFRSMQAELGYSRKWLKL